jgi:heme exporter protein A
MNASVESASLRVAALQCVRGERRLFSDLSFSLTGGTLLQVCGANGSGKTSLLRMVCGLLAPVAGEIYWNGQHIGKLAENYHAVLAYVGHLNGVKDELDPAENLTLAARLAGLPAHPGAIAAALQGFGLTGCERLPCKLLSQGQKRRAALARLTLSGERPLWVLDEPFAALDAGGVGYARSLIEAHLAGGGIVLLTTHQEVDVAAPSTQRIEFRS